MSLITLINSNRMQPPIAPLGLEYIATAGRAAGLEVEFLDLCLVDNPNETLRDYFSIRQPLVVGISLRNLDDCFWPSAQWFIPRLKELILQIRSLTPAPILLGGVGFSLAPRRIMDYTRADFGIHGDGESALIALARQLQDAQRFEEVPGLLWVCRDRLHVNPPAWPETLSIPSSRDVVDNLTYFKQGGQIGLETKRGCARRCIYCADPLAKGPVYRLRNPREVADEAEILLKQGIEVLHICDGEFNLPRTHAVAVCEEMVRRGLGERMRWYAYLAVTPFDNELALFMRRAGCVGIDFTGDAASPAMLRRYAHPHTPDDLTAAVDHCHRHGIAVMIDLLLGGPGETPQTVAETLAFIKKINPDCIGAPLGLRLYENTPAADIVRREGPLEENPGICRKYSGPVDFFQPTFYISPALGERPAALVRDLIDGDPRFFAPEDDTTTDTDHNYNDNTPLVEAIAAGARGAYWHILHQIRGQ